MSENPPVVFVTGVAVSGFNNGNCNFAFNTAQFLPGLDEEGKPRVELAEVITANLRMDLFCAQQLHDSLAALLAQHTKPKREGLNS